jgi:hypothetical protein
MVGLGGREGGAFRSGGRQLASKLEPCTRGQLGGLLSTHALICRTDWVAALACSVGTGSGVSGRVHRPSASPPLRASSRAVNGLPILAWEPYLDQYYKENVIGGPGAFMIVAREFDAFADAILKKMIIEIAMDPRPGPTRIGKR